MAKRSAAALRAFRCMLLIYGRFMMKVGHHHSLNDGDPWYHVGAEIVAHFWSVQYLRYRMHKTALACIRGIAALYTLDSSIDVTKERRSRKACTKRSRLAANLPS